jgi:peptide/nickel transport system permease protein
MNPRYLARRLLISVIMLWVASAVIFVVLRILPGDPVTTQLGSVHGVDAQVIAQTRHRLGIDRPLLAQYGSWLSGLFTGHFGTSYFSMEPVQTLLVPRIWPTVELAMTSMILALLFAVPAAIMAAVRPRGLVDRAVTGIASLGMSVPPFLMAIVLIVTFAVKLRILPTSGYVSVFADPVQNLKLLAMPAATLAFSISAPILRFLRASLADVSEASYIRTAEGKGLLWPTVIRRHATPNALIPTLTVVGVTVGQLLGGVVIIEYIFSWPGLGTLIVDSVTKRDYPVLQTAILLAAVAFIVTTLVVDVLYGILDPRLKARTGATA